MKIVVLAFSAMTLTDRLPQVQYSVNWHQTGAFSLLGFSSHFFEPMADQSVPVQPIELISQIGQE
ncbi:MAG TPA: hypothetical protein V6D34_03825 [Candidatus Sericytochromatia bacterium]